MFQSRVDLGVRIGGEKANKPDEFITRSQIIPGTNVTFEYLDNDDIRINALGGAESAGASQIIRQLTAVVAPYYYPDSDTDGSIGAFESISELHAGAETASRPGSGVTSAYKKNHFSDPKGCIIYHGWNLSNPVQDDKQNSSVPAAEERSRFLYSVQEVTGIFDAPNTSEHANHAHLVQVIAIDGDRVWVRLNSYDGSAIDTSNFIPNTRTFIDGDKALYGSYTPERVRPDYHTFLRVTLMEVL